jgi:putative oxidoreductase
MVGLLNRFQDLLDRSRILDFLPLLALRIYLVPIFWMAGSNKWSSMDSTIEWFGNPDWGLGLPFPTLMAYLATLTELFGAVFLATGFMVRWISIPLMVTMIVAMVTVHWQNGWLAIAEGTGIFATERTEGAITRLDKAKEILQQHGNYDWLTQNGNFVVLNNGIEFAATYFIMLLVLFFFGAGRYFSMDYWIARAYRDDRR